MPEPLVSKPGTYHELLRFVQQQVKPAGALLFIVNGIRGTAFECMGSPEIVTDLPRLLRKLADEIEQTGGIKLPEPVCTCNIAKSRRRTHLASCALRNDGKGKA